MNNKEPVEHEFDAAHSCNITTFVGGRKIAAFIAPHRPSGPELVQHLVAQTGWLAAERTLYVVRSLARARPDRTVHMPQRRLAELAGLSRPMLNRCLQELQDDGVVTIGHGVTVTGGG